MNTTFIMLAEVWMTDLPPNYRPPIEAGDLSWLWLMVPVAFIVVAAGWMIRRTPSDMVTPDRLTRELFRAHRMTKAQQRQWMERARALGCSHPAELFISGKHDPSVEPTQRNA